MIEVERPTSSMSSEPLLRCLVVGAGAGGRAIARDLLQTPDFGLRPIGFVDDDLSRRRVLGLPVLGSTASLAQLAVKHRVEVVVIAIPSLSSAAIQRLVERASEAGVSVRYLPSFLAAMQRVGVSDLRSLRIDRLLGRREVHVVRSSSRAVVAGRRVLVTGAGGSIGSELCRQIKGFGPAALYLLDHDESNLHRLQLELTGQGLLETDDIIIADIRDESRIRQVFTALLPEVVFHAAAHKHLPLLERHPCEGVKSNVLGTRNLVKSALETGVERFILISTDKAADPTSILGATKLLAESVLQMHAGGTCKFASVRFGNVLGSRGSFLSVLSEQIATGQDVTVTHPEVTRFFMTVEEAVGLVLEAAGMAQVGETFVLDMGEPVRIVDLVFNYAAEFHVPKDRIRIRYTGLRQGEKLNETLFSGREAFTQTNHPKIWATVPQPAPRAFETHLQQLFEAAMDNDSARVRDLLKHLLPEFAPHSVEGGKAQLPAPYPDGF